MTIALTKVQIDTAIPRVAEGLHKYLWLQDHRDSGDLRSDAEYQRRFNHFYRVRRGKTWQKYFYALLESKKGTRVAFGEILDALYRSTHRHEASFASKLLATIDPDMPVIDSMVLRNLRLRLPPPTSSDRLAMIRQLYTKLLSLVQRFLATADGQYLVSRFRAAYPSAAISETKMLDLVLWQTREKVDAVRSQTKL